jgi:hypothetical protein
LLTITSEDDAEHLQEDLDKLAQWGEDWFMQFHPAKCVKAWGPRSSLFIEFAISLLQAM